MLTRSQMSETQHEIVDIIKREKKFAVFAGLGVGKTVCSLTAIADLLDDFAVSRVLVVSTLRICQSTWPNEIRNWEHLADLDFAVAIGTPVERINALASGKSITLINRENVDWLVTYYGRSWPFDMVVIDESTAFKKHSSGRFKALKKVIAEVEYVVLLTGTPIPNGYLGLWSQFYLIDQGERLGRNISMFRTRYFNAAGFKGYSYVLKDGAGARIRTAIEDKSVSVAAQSHNDIARITLSIECPLPSKLMKEYKQLQKTMILEVGEATISAPTLALVQNKLSQFCNGFLYDEDQQAHLIHDAKLEALEDLLEDNPSDNILVSYQYKADLARILEKFPEARELDKNPQTITDWNAGKIRLLVAHPASAGHGLNIQQGGSVIVWYGLPWDLEHYIQMNGRLDRQGQVDTVRVIHLVVPGTIEQRIADVLVNKASTQQDLLDFLKLELF